MTAISRLWTWIGYAFIPTAIAWIYIVRNGADQPIPADGVIISRAYWGLAISLLAGAALAWTYGLYLREARADKAAPPVPANTSLESEGQRNPVVSWGTVIFFIVFVLAALIVFGVRYSESTLYPWDSATPVADGFWASRLAAHKLGCLTQPCYAVANHFGGKTGVNEYILYVTDGVLFLLAALLVGGLIFTRLQLSLRKSSLAGIHSRDALSAD